MEIIKKNIYSGLKVVASLIGKRYPIKVNFIMTYACNYNCKYCDVKSLQERQMNTLEIFGMIDTFRKLGMEQITFIGGEPLLRNDIGDIISYARKKGVLTLVSTNGSLIEEKINDLEGLDIMAICLNGPKEVHDKIRGKGSYDDVIKSIGIAKKKNIKVILNSIIYYTNKEYIDFILNFADKNKVMVDFQAIFKSSLSNAGEIAINKLKLKRDDIKEIFSYIQKKKKKSKVIINSMPYLDQMAKKGYFSVRRCSVFGKSCAVSPSGIVGNCYNNLYNNKHNNGNKKGWEIAFNNIEKPNCKICEDGCYIEDNLLFSFNPRAILNLLKVGKKAFGKTDQG